MMENQQQQWLQQQIATGFRKNFEKYCDKRIAIYGIGDNAKRVVSWAEGLDITAVAARDHFGEIFCGRKIIPLAEAVAHSDLMIIAATPQSTKEVFARIGSHLPSEYPVFDLYGHILTEHIDADNAYWEKTLAGLEREIDAHEVISFDIFDTLLMRKTLMPQDVFSLEEMELDEAGEHVPFAEWRKKAEASLYARGVLPTIDEIYQTLRDQQGISETTMRRWQMREWNLENIVLVPRNDMVEAFRYAKMQGKTVCLTSDMYFPCADMERLLADRGIAGQDKTLVSCDVQASKQNGMLYRHLLTFADGRSVLHIGDNFHADGEIPHQLGIDTYLIKKASDILAISSAAQALAGAETLEDRILLGTIIAHCFNSPFALADSRGKLMLDTFDYMAWMCFLPILMRFLQYIVSVVVREPRCAVLFLARDGYFLQKIYASLAEKHGLPDSFYVYASRQAANGVMVENRADIELFLQLIFHGRLDENLKFQLEYFFEIPFGEAYDCTVRAALDRWGEEGLIHMIEREEDRIFQAQAARRLNYRTYLQTLPLGKYSKIFCIDLATKGTAQRALEKLLQRPVDLVAMGGFMHLKQFASDKDQCFLMCGMMNQFTRIRSWFPLLEILWASREGQLRSFTIDGHPIFVEGSEYRADFLDVMQSALQKAVTEFPDDGWLTRPISDGFAQTMLELLSPSYSDIADAQLDGFVMTDPQLEFSVHGFNPLRRLREQDSIA